jgi:type II secretory pathway component PulF
MSAFRYKAKDTSGHTVEGVMHAPDRKSVVTALRQQGYFVVSIYEITSDSIRTSGIGNILGWLYNSLLGRVNIAQLMFFYHQLAAMMKAGMTLVQAMDSLASGQINRRLRKVVNEVKQHLESGGCLSDALARYPWIFPELHVHLVRAGEFSGTLDRIVERIANMLDCELRLRRRLSLATLYPKILVLAVIFIPKFPVLIFDGLRQYMKVTIGVILPIVTFCLLAWAVYRLLSQLSGFRYFTDFVKLLLPRVGKIALWSAEARFCRVLAAMVAAGISLSEGVCLAANSCGNSVLASRLKKAVPQIQQGRSLALSLTETGALSRRILEMLAVGERTGSIDSLLDRVAEYTENELEMLTIQTIVILGVILFLGVAAYIGTFVVRFYQTYYSNIGNQAW